MHPKRQQKITQLFISMLCFGAAVACLLWAMQDSMNSYFTPKEALKKGKVGRVIQLGGLVLEGSLQQDSKGCFLFAVTDEQDTLNVRFCGLLPALFREGQGVIAIGPYQGESQLIEATRLLAKHDEYYRPPGTEAVQRRLG